MNPKNNYVSVSPLYLLVYLLENFVEDPFTCITVNVLDSKYVLKHVLCLCSLYLLCVTSFLFSVEPSPLSFFSIGLLSGVVLAYLATVGQMKGGIF